MPFLHASESLGPPYHLVTHSEVKGPPLVNNSIKAYKALSFRVNAALVQFLTLKVVGGSQPSLWQNLAGRWRSQLFCLRVGHTGFRNMLSGIFSGSLSFTDETHFMCFRPKHVPTIMIRFDLRHSKGRSNPGMLFWGPEL